MTLMTCCFGFFDEAGCVTHTENGGFDCPFRYCTVALFMGGRVKPRARMGEEERRDWEQTGCDTGSGVYYSTIEGEPISPSGIAQFFPHKKGERIALLEMMGLYDVAANFTGIIHRTAWGGHGSLI